MGQFMLFIWFHLAEWKEVAEISHMEKYKIETTRSEKATKYQLRVYLRLEAISFPRLCNSI